MEINEKTTQRELEKLYEDVLKREFIHNTPLNLRMFLRYMILFLLFPGMVFGFWAGLVLTAIMSAIMLGCLFIGNDSIAMTVCYCWFGIGALVLAYVCTGVTRKAITTKTQRRTPRPAQESVSSPITAPNRTELYWHKKKEESGTRYAAKLPFKAPKDGIYAILVSVAPFEQRRLLTAGLEGTCVVHFDHGSNGTYNALILYKLEKGDHELVWVVEGKDGPRPKAQVTQINRHI